MEVDRAWRGELIGEARRLLRKYRIRPKRRLGQNFVINPKLISEMASLADPSRFDVVLEIGSGLGFLTRALASRAEEVVGLEIDGKLVKASKEVIGDVANVHIVRADALTFPWPNAKVIISNIPYSIASPLLEKMLREAAFDRAVITVQKELALRMLAGPGERNYGRLSVLINLFSEVEFIRTVPRWDFIPRPKVDSALLLLRPKEPHGVADLRIFMDLTRHLFSYKNKLLQKPLERYLTGLVGREGARSIISKLNGLPARRIRELGVKELALISNLIAKCF